MTKVIQLTSGRKWRKESKVDALPISLNHYTVYHDLNLPAIIEVSDNVLILQTRKLKLIMFNNLSTVANLTGIEDRIPLRCVLILKKHLFTFHSTMLPFKIYNSSFVCYFLIKKMSLVIK